MPRHSDVDVAAAFVEFRNGKYSITQYFFNEQRCVSVQCLFCNQIRAKNTTRQKQHLLTCAPYLQAHPDVALQASAAAAQATAAPPPSAPPAPQLPPPQPQQPQQPHQPHQPQQSQQQQQQPVATHDAQHTPQHAAHVPSLPPPPANYGHDDAGASGAAAAAADHTNMSFMPNARVNGSPSHPRPSLGGEGTPAKKQKIKAPGNSNLPEIPLHDVHAAFVEMPAQGDQKCAQVRCIYCNQIRAKNTSRQREHLMACAGYQPVLKDKIPANNLRHQFDEADIASSLVLPVPTIDVDFRMSIRVKPKLSIGPNASVRQSWVSCVGGQWAGNWGKGIFLPGGQDIQLAPKDSATRIDSTYLMQTSDDQPALIVCKMSGWLTGERDVMERLQDPVAADNVAAGRYRLRVTMQLETGDERYQDLNTAMWLCSGCRRGAEIVYDAYRVN
ncbi:uncharacterized protein C8A04DRAFT_11142 [Dichotomopilus funicola]|uniref:Uncharacterized protein n=1 Tax=Dichotomopilus funicola TaxID=1934379 RepID=A0AAN6ZND4_9PEZI|nr:hypothetical protein C8A04DRAFT_11142 [Dichotomopilus funicola]